MVRDAKPIIGRSCEVTFTDFSKEQIPAKIDTGAYHSSVHAENIHLDDNGVLHFTILGGHPVTNEFAANATTTEYRTATIENSFGDQEVRYEVDFNIVIDGKPYKTPFSLANRSKKIYPILIGRLLLNDNFLIDTTKSPVDRKVLKQKYQDNLPK